MDTHGNEYHQIRVHIHQIISSQIPMYYTCGYLFRHMPRARDKFFTRVPVGMGVFATPTIIQPSHIMANTAIQFVLAWTM